MSNGTCILKLNKCREEIGGCVVSTYSCNKCGGSMLDVIQEKTKDGTGDYMGIAMPQYCSHCGREVIGIAGKKRVNVNICGFTGFMYVDEIESGSDSEH